MNIKYPEIWFKNESIFRLLNGDPNWEKYKGKKLTLDEFKELTNFSSDKGVYEPHYKQLVNVIFDRPHKVFE